MSEAPEVTNDEVFVDTETTGRSALVHKLVEACWAVNDEPVNRTVFDHTLEHADMEALGVNGYFERGLDKYAVAPGQVGRGLTDQQRRLITDLRGATLIAQNYDFDTSFLLHRLGFEPWNYRKVELSSVAMLVFDLPRPEGLRTTANRLRDLGFTITANDHTAENDVECLRDCYRALRRVRREAMPPAAKLLESQAVAF